MSLNLKNPLVVLDVETTGLDISKDRIIELAMVKLMPNGETKEYLQRFNPNYPISKEAEATHKISLEMLKDEPTFKEKAKDIEAFLKGCDVGGFNSNKFDIPIIVEEFLRVDIDIDFKSRKLVDAQNIFHKMEKRTLVAAYKFYCGKDLEGAHSALCDTKATLEVLQSQVERYVETEKTTLFENNIESIAEFSKQNDNVDYLGRIIYNDKKEMIFSFGKHKDKTLKEVFEKEPSFFNWMLTSDFPLSTKKVLTQFKIDYLKNR